MPTTITMANQAAFTQIGEVAIPVIESTNALMQELNEAGVQPTPEMALLMFKFKAALDKAKLFCLFADEDADTSKDVEELKTLIQEVGNQFRLGLEIEHSLKVRK